MIVIVLQNRFSFSTISIKGSEVSFAITCLCVFKIHCFHSYEKIWQRSCFGFRPPSKNATTFKDDRNGIELLKSKYPFLLSTVELTGVKEVETIACEILQQNDSICVTAEKYSCLREILGDEIDIPDECILRVF